MNFELKADAASSIQNSKLKIHNFFLCVPCDENHSTWLHLCPNAIAC